MIRWVHLIRICVVAVGLGLLAGCNALKLGYNNFDTAAFWWLDGYLHLDEGQSQRLRQDLSRLQRWHRERELPRLVPLLGRAAQLAAGDVTAAQVCSLTEAVRDRLAAVAVQVEPTSATLALELNNEQLLNLQIKYQGNNREYHKDWIEPGPEKGRQKRLRQFQDRIESVYGALEPSQQQVLRQELQRSAHRPELQLRHRQQRQQDILQTLRRLGTPSTSLGEARSSVSALMLRGLRPADAETRGYQDTITQEVCRTVATLHNVMTPKQRQNAVEKLRAYQRDLEDLAVQP